MKLLAEHKATTSDDRFMFGDARSFLDPDRFDAEVWTPIVDLAGMKGTRFHDLRHFFASQSIANGETAAFVRDQMGHSSIQITFDTYGHLFPEKTTESSKRFEESMRKAKTASRASGSNLVAIPEGEAQAVESSNAGRKTLTN